MISQSLYQALCDCVNELNSTALPSEVEDEYQRLNRPYVLVIHRPSRRGFYLDRQYRHIVDVKNCQEPKKFIEVARRHHLCPSSDLPAWVLMELDATDNFNCYNSFWLY